MSKQVAAAQSKIKAVRRVVKQLQGEIIQQWSSVSSCMQTRIAMEEHCTGCSYISCLKQMVVTFRIALVLAKNIQKTLRILHTNAYKSLLDTSLGQV
jgi:hypothetical protein